jgi:hypothetical protein
MNGRDIIELYINKSQGDVVESLLGLPSDYRPIYYSFSERFLKTNLVSDTLNFQKACNAGIGIALKAKKLVYFFDPGRRGSSFEVTVFPKANANATKAAFEQLAVLGAFFSFACNYNEYSWRHNLYAHVADSGIRTLWAGRNCLHYVPGFYWLTMISEKYAFVHGVDLLKVADAAISSKKIDADRHIFQFYNDPSEYISNKNAENLCETLDGVFNIYDVLDLWLPNVQVWQTKQKADDEIKLLKPWP